MAGINEDNRESKRTGQITTFSRSQRNQLRYPEIYRGIVSYCLFLPTIESNATAGKKRRATAKEAKQHTKTSNSTQRKSKQTPRQIQRERQIQSSQIIASGSSPPSPQSVSSSSKSMPPKVSPKETTEEIKEEASGALHLFVGGVTCI